MILSFRNLVTKSIKISILCCFSKTKWIKILPNLRITTSYLKLWVGCRLIPKSFSHYPLRPAVTRRKVFKVSYMCQQTYSGEISPDSSRELGKFIWSMRASRISLSKWLGGQREGQKHFMIPKPKLPWC